MVDKFSKASAVSLRASVELSELKGQKTRRTLISRSIHGTCPIENSLISSKAFSKGFLRESRNKKIALAASLHPENKMISDDIGGLFQSVANGVGFYVAPTASYSTVGGNILNGTGRVYIRTQPQFLPDPRNYSAGVYRRASSAYLTLTYRQMAQTTIHELLHHAGFNDRALADAVARYNHLDPVSFASTWEGTLAASQYWDKELFKHCH